MAALSLLSLPDELLLRLADHVRNIEDYTALYSSCRRLRAISGSTAPRTIFHLAAAQSSTFFRPEPFVLATATARELGDWARQSEANEAALAEACQQGVEGIIALALLHCGLTMEKIRELYEMRFSIINPVVDIIDKCVGNQWYSTPNFWSGGVSDAYTVTAEPGEAIFHLALYNELFGPDIIAYLKRSAANDDSHKPAQPRCLSVDTRLEYIKYCVPDFACTCGRETREENSGTADSRRIVKAVGPYKDRYRGPDNSVALVWTLRSSRWRPHWKEFRDLAGGDFNEDYDEDWWYLDDEADDDTTWRQRLWESALYAQGLAGLGMMRPKLRDQWTETARELRDQVAGLKSRPAWIEVGRQATAEYPFLQGDLRICTSGYVAGT